MVRLSTAGGSLGIVTGMWTLAGSYLNGVMRNCPAGACPPAGLSILGVAIIVLSIGLVFNSAASFFWHRRVLYVSALLSALVAVSVLLEASGANASVMSVTIALSVASTLTNLVAARATTSVSEQSNPMNLPVFG